MALLTDIEIKKAIEDGEVEIEPFDEEHCLQPASYDMRVGERAIVAKSISLEELRRKVEKEEAKELLLSRERSLVIPSGGLALITTFEKIKLSNRYAGHIGIASRWSRKGLGILSGLQIDPGWDGVLVLGLCNHAPRSIVLDYKDPLCTIEIHRLNVEPGRPYPGPYMAEQREGKIPTEDKAYLRTIETMSISDLTQALFTLSQNVDRMARTLRYFWIPLGIAVLAALLAAVFSAVF